MFANTSSLSLYLGLTFIVIALIGSLAIAWAIFRTGIDQTKVDKLIEIVKWFVISVAIVIGASIISDSFKEREQDIKEIGVFDKYVTTITEAKGIEKRWLLAQYFSFVAPPGELRKSWEAYKVAIKPEFDEYRKSKDEENALEAKKKITNLTNVEETRLAEVQKVNKVQEQSLVSKGEAGEILADEWLIVAATDTTLAAAQDELKKAQSLSPQAKIYKKGGSYITVIRSFISAEAALTVLPRVKQTVSPDAYIVVAKTLCTNLSDKTDYLECN